jgi:hypothetical protein
MLPNLQAKLTSLNLKQYQWLWYPISVGFVILGATLYLLVNVTNLMDTINQKQKNNADNERNIASLSEKLNLLKQITPEELDTRIQELQGVYPTSLNLLSYSTAVQNLAGQLNVSVANFRSTSSKSNISLTVSFEVSNINDVLRILTEVYNQKPVMRVTALAFRNGRLDLTLEPGWSENIKPIFDSQTPLPR